MKTLIKNGTVVDPAQKINGVCDVLIDGASIARVSSGIKEKADSVIDATGKIVVPGLVDMHVHLREPGREDKETVATGTLAAVRGGMTSVVAMPNTSPCIDSAESVGLLQDIIARTAQSHVFIAAAITKKRCGKELTDCEELKKRGVVALTDDGASVDSDDVMREALKRARKEGLLVICHSEDKVRAAAGVVNLGIVSTRLGLRGISKESEYERVRRDIRLAQETGARIHIAHVSCEESVEAISLAKKQGVAVTCETCPHYFSLTENAVEQYDTNFKMNPPLRTAGDVAAIIQGLRDGTIDAIASDHAPHTENEKEIEFDRAEFGVIGLETELAVAISALVIPGTLDWSELVKKMSYNPACILGIKKGTVSVGSDADVTVISPDERWTVRAASLASKSKNSPFLGRTLTGAVAATFVAGKKVFERSG